MTEPPLVPRRLRPGALVESFGEAVLWPTVDGLLRRVDLTDFVLAHVSIPRIVEAIDIKAVLATVDVSGVADQVVRDLDLPQIIRTSSEALSTDAVVGLRLQSASADDVVDRLVGRLVHRRHADVAITPRPEVAVKPGWEAP
ncbi:MAG TPA: hypothetical protein VKB75_02475 [Jatrophihabitans sp.]|nr:hypothetical protein [Jatrophihabitans sp.]